MKMNFVRSLVLAAFVPALTSAVALAQAASTNQTSGTNSAPAPRRAKKVYPTMGSIERLDPALDLLRAPGAVIEKLASGFAWSEGPVWIKGGDYLLFSDIPHNVIFKWREG